MITSNKIKKVQEKIKSALLQIEKEENVKIKFGTCRYTDVDYKSTMTVTTKAKDQKTEKAVQSKNLQLSKSYGFETNIVGKQIQLRAGKGVITGFKTRNRKYPIIVECTNGKTYKIDPPTVKFQLK